jgi:hypothetical protein
MIEVILNHRRETGGINYYVLIKNLLILLVALLGFTTGTYESVKAIITS